jgi:hypothetical protein
MQNDGATGLGNSEAKRRAQKACRLTAEPRREFEYFLLHEGGLMSSAHIAAQWVPPCRWRPAQREGSPPRVARQTVTAYRRRHCHVEPFGIVSNPAIVGVQEADP